MRYCNALSGARDCGGVRLHRVGATAAGDPRPASDRYRPMAASSFAASVRSFAVSMARQYAP
jgi:hypothetical protein